MTRCNTERKDTRIHDEQAIRRPRNRRNTVFLDAMWVDLWPLETDLPCPTSTTARGARRNDPLHARRHGGHSGSAPRDFDLRQRMPGAIDIGMADGHVELVKLEKLWIATGILAGNRPPRGRDEKCNSMKATAFRGLDLSSRRTMRQRRIW